MFRMVRSSRSSARSGRSRESPFISAFKNRAADSVEAEVLGTRIAEGPLAHWDVFHADRLELERGLDTAAIRHALERGDLRDDDLVRPAGTTVTWSRLAEVPELTEAASPSPELTKKLAGLGRSRSARPAGLGPRAERLRGRIRRFRGRPFRFSRHFALARLGRAEKRSR